MPESKPEPDPKTDEATTDNPPLPSDTLPSDTSPSDISPSDTLPDATSSDPVSDSEPSNQPQQVVRDDGPGWMPAVMAATVLMGIMAFIFCAFSTWLLYQKRTELATRTLTEAYLPELEQSLLEPDTKSAVMETIEELAEDMQRGKLDDWQSAAVMQRLQRLPVLQWGDLQAVQAFINRSGTPEQAAEASMQLNRLRKSVANNKATSFDFVEVLSPVHVEDPTVSSGRRLGMPLDLDAAMDVVKRAQLLADREKIPSTQGTGADVSIESIMQEQIQAGIRDGAY